MKHNAELQKALITRLKNPDEGSFHGAYYETIVAGTFIKAGYEIAFENEKDGATTHCEFVATPKPGTGKFSVEAKARVRRAAGTGVSPNTLKLGVKDKLESALRKRADHARVIFIDVNMPESDAANRKPAWIDAALNEISDLESTMAASGQEAPPAYVILTNLPYQFDENSGTSAVLTAFNIPDCRFGNIFPNLRAALDAREKHAEIYRAFDWVTKLREIPATFDGEMPELHFNAEENRASLQIGSRYLVPTQDGKIQQGQLTHAVVAKDKKLAFGIYRLDNGASILVSTPLTDREMNAYRKYPDTFFGAIDKNAARKCNTVVDWYDFFFETYIKTPKERLLDFMKSSDDIELLKCLSQEELAKIYCERLVYSLDRNLK